MAVVNSIGAGVGRDFSTIAAWEASLPATLADAYVGECYNDSEFTGTTGIVTFSGSTTSATNTITLTCASGESFRDHAAVQTNALAYNQANGVGLKITSSYSTAIVVSEDNVILDGLQVKATASHAASVSPAASAAAVQNCILDALGNGGNGVLGNVTHGTYVNNLIICRSSGGTGVRSSYPSSIVFENNTVVAPSGTAGSVGFNSAHGSMPVVNCAVFGFTTNFSGTLTGNNNASDQTISFGTSNQASLTYADQFVDSTADWRLKTGSALIDAGAADATNVPDDIAGTTRPSGSAYDIGCWEFVTSGGGTTPTVKPLAALGVG